MTQLLEQSKGDDASAAALRRLLIGADGKPRSFDELVAATSRLSAPQQSAVSQEVSRGANRRLRRFFDDVAILTRGKRFGILGPRAAGKTTLHTWLREGRLEVDYRPTLGAQRVNGRREKLRDRTNGAATGLLNIKQGTDVPGARATNFADWRKVVAESDVLVYMFDLKRLVDGDDDHRRDVTGDCTMLGQLIYDHHGDKDKPRVLLIGSHCDQVAGYAARSNAAAHLKFVNRIAELATVKDAQHYLRQARDRALRPPLVLGALNDVDNAHELTVALIGELGK